jgi:hypothetical protein
MAGQQSDSPKSSETDDKKPLDRVIDAALSEIEAVGWSCASMPSIAARAELPLGEALLLAPNKTCLLHAFIDRIDARTLSPVKKLDPDDSPRDRLFELAMRRFDALNERRSAVRAVVNGAARDPTVALAGVCRLQRSFAGMLEAAGISSSGLTGLARMQGLGGVLACALKAWMDDDSQDLAKTMAALDRALDKAEKLARFTVPRSRSQQDAPSAAEGAAG